VSIESAQKLLDEISGIHVEPNLTKREKWCRSKGNLGKTKGVPHVSKRDEHKLAMYLNSLFYGLFPDSGEGKLMHSILSHTVSDALAMKAPKRHADLVSEFYQTQSVRNMESARRALSEPMWFCSISNVSNSYIRKIMALAYDLVNDKERLRAVVRYIETYKPEMIQNYDEVDV